MDWNRRELLRAAMVAATTGATTAAVTGAPACAAADAATQALANDAAAPSVARPRLIAVEEGFNIPEIARETPAAMARRLANEPGEAAVFGIGSPPPPSGSAPPPWAAKISDVGERRLLDMDAAGVDQQVILLSSPGVQIFDAARASALAALANDRLGEAVRRHPERFAGLAAFAPQNPEAAARELERAVRRLGLKGGIVNSHTFGEYLDEPRYAPIFAAAETLDVPIYLHPRAPSPRVVGGYLDHGLVGAIWGYAAETSLHALRLIFGGVFDRHPRLRMVLGHLGEGIPFFLDRVDTHHASGGGQGPSSAKLRRRPSEYFLEHFVVTTSGMNWEPAVQLCLKVLGADRVLFAADYPFEDMKLAAQRFGAMNIDAETRAKIAHRNAQRVFRLL